MRMAERMQRETGGYEGAGGDLIDEEVRWQRRLGAVVAGDEGCEAGAEGKGGPAGEPRSVLHLRHATAECHSIQQTLTNECSVGDSTETIICINIACHRRQVALAHLTATECTSGWG